MTCVICKRGETQPGTTRVAVERGPTVLVVRGVPAQVCENFGGFSSGSSSLTVVTARFAATN